MYDFHLCVRDMPEDIVRCVHFDDESHCQADAEDTKKDDEADEPSRKRFAMAALASMAALRVLGI
jgi:hypothetical protein